MSSIISERLPWRKLGLVVGTLALFLSLFLSFGVQTSYAASVEIKDDANVLSSSDESSLRSSASSLPNFTVRFFTTDAYNDVNSFRNGVSSNAPSSGVIYAVSPKLKSYYVVSNGNTGISSSERESIASAGSSSFSSGNYKSGFDAMVSSTRSFASTTSSSTATRSTSSGGGFPIFGCLIIGIIALVAISVFGAGRRRAMNNNTYNPGYGQVPGPGYGPGPGNNYGPGYGPNYGPGYGNNYGPGYGNQGGGIGPLGGGIIGAGLGGLAGYELGRQAGHNDVGYGGGFGATGTGGSFGGNESSSGGSGGSWDTGGSGGDWGGSGGGSDWGSSGSFDAGGGGDWGGGGGDSGGGGGGSGDSW